MERLKSVLRNAGVNFQSMWMLGGGYEKRITHLKETEHFIVCVVNHSSFHENTDTLFIVSKNGEEVLFCVRNKNRIISVKEFKEEKGYAFLTFTSAPNNHRNNKIEKKYKFKIITKPITKLDNI